MFNLSQQSLLLRLGMAMATIIALAFVGMLSSVFIAETSEGFAAAINQAGTLRMQSYRIASSLVHRSSVETPYSSAATLKLVDEFEVRLLSPRIHNVLTTSAPPEVHAAYRDVETRWVRTIRPQLDDFVKTVNKLQHSDASGHDERIIQRAQHYYLSNVDGFVDAIHYFVKVLELEAEDKIQRLRVIQLVSLVLTLLVIGIIMYLVHADVRLPLRDLLRSARAARRGDFSVRTHPSKDDELGQLGYAFNRMAEDLSVMYADLEERVRSKTADLERSNRSLELLYLTTKRLGESPLDQELLLALIHDIEQLLGIRGGTICLGHAGDQQAFKLASTISERDWYSAESAEPGCQRCFGSGESHIFEISGDDVDEAIVFSAPIRDKEQQYGVLLVELDSGSVLEEWQQRLLEMVASHIAMALNLAQRASQSRMVSLLEERGVIARELHDSLAQSLSYMKIQVSRLEKAINDGKDRSQVLDISGGIRNGLNGAYRELRELLTTFRLRISEAGLNAALEDTVREFRERGNVAIELDNQIANCQFGPNAEIHMIQIIREALSNVIRHAKATRAVVSLACDADGRVTLTVDDNGVGLSDNMEELHHYGLPIMQERAQGLGGTLVFAESEYGGTRVQLTFRI